MVMAIESSRFGHVEIDPETVIEFPDGLIGLGGRRFALVATDTGGPIVWLHCIDDPTLSLPVTDPHRFFSGYRVELTDEDAERLGVDESAPVDVFVTVVAGSQPSDFTANQKAPILIRDGRGHQVINQAPGCDFRAPLFAEVQAGLGGGAPLFAEVQAGLGGGEDPAEC
jgi:flagellar assembly factor FliW